jgi:hypothetical protein
VGCIHIQAIACITHERCTAGRLSKALDRTCRTKQRTCMICKAGQAKQQHETARGSGSRQQGAPIITHNRCGTYWCIFSHHAPQHTAEWQSNAGGIQVQRPGLPWYAH